MGDTTAAAATTEQKPTEATKPAEAAPEKPERRERHAQTLDPSAVLAGLLERIQSLEARLPPLVDDAADDEPETPATPATPATVAPATRFPTLFRWTA